jgi:hypothetical protein
MAHFHNLPISGKTLTFEANNLKISLDLRAEHKLELMKFGIHKELSFAILIRLLGITMSIISCPSDALFAGTITLIIMWSYQISIAHSVKHSNA